MLVRGLLLSSAWLAGANRVLFSFNRSSELSLQGQQGTSVDCVVRECNRVHSYWSDEDHHTKAELNELNLCAVGHVARSCKSKSWQDAAKATQAGCPGAGDAGELAFGESQCRADDLCSPVGARIALLLTVCGSGAGATPPVREVTCGHFSDYQWGAAVRNICIALVTQQGNNLTILEQVGRSLLCGCDSLRPAGSRREGSIFQRSRNGLYIVKLLSQSDVENQKRLVLGALKHSGRHPLLENPVYFDAHRRAIVMKNFFNAAAIGLTAEQVLPAGAHSQCAQNLGVDLLWHGGYDVKPKPAKSAERAPFLAQIVRHQWRLKDWHGWADLMPQLNETLQFLKDENLVDYSLLVSLWTASAQNGTRAPSCEPRLLGSAPRKCVLSPRCSAAPAGPEDQDGFFAFQSGSGAPGGTQCDLVCVTVVDYLMEFDWTRRIESYFKEGKWTNYARKVSHLAQCMGDLTADNCREFREIGCTQLWETGDVRLDELVWCKEYYHRVPRIPMRAWLRTGCVPDPDWKDPQGDHCEDYADVLIQKGDFSVRGSEGRNPVDACCATHQRYKGVTFAPAHGQADEGSEPATTWKLPTAVWKSNGCIADDLWKDRAGRDCGSFYNGLEFFDWDWMNKDIGLSMTPMEACCLDRVGGKIIYSSADWLFRGNGGDDRFHAGMRPSP